LRESVHLPNRPRQVLISSPGSCALAAAQPAAAGGAARLLRGHGVIQAAAWFLLLFPGAFVARFRTALGLSKVWFKLHMYMQLAGVTAVCRRPPPYTPYSNLIPPTYYESILTL
jgi:hypothetical protein